MSRDDDRDEREVLHTHGKPPAGIEHPPIECHRCGTLTARATLNTFGARCVPCYFAFCREWQPSPSIVGDKRNGGSRDWARALKAREEAGEILTPAQRAMWRAATRFESTEEVPA